MTERYGNRGELEGELVVNKDDFRLGSLEDELRVDGFDVLWPLPKPWQR